MPRSPRLTQTRPFQCRICKSSFSKNEHLVRHIRSHTKEKPYACPDCGNRYGRQDILIRHRRDVKCQPPEKRNTGGEPADTAPNGTSAISDSVIHTSPGLQEAITPGVGVSGDVGAPTPTSANNNSSPHVGNGRFAPLCNPPIWTGPTPVAPAESLQAGGVPTSILIDEIGLNWFDLSGFDAPRHIDAGLREEISPMDLSSFQQSHQLFQTAPSEPVSPELSQVQSVQHLWFTTIAEDPPQAITIPDNQNYEQPAEILSPETSVTTISEDQRQSMWSRLCIHTYEPTVLPTDLLNVGLRLYLAKVNPIFPLVHAATFQPCRENADLVIAMCAIGGLFTGSEQSLQQGTYLFERVHKATLHNWEQLLARGRRELTIAIQSAAISQLFGLLSGSPDLLLTVDAFHGPPIAWLRYLRLYSRHQDITHSQIDSAVDDYELTKLWHDWARNEEIVRVAHGLFIMDAELGGTLHHEPIQSWEAYKLPFACSERAFAASNARDWKEIYREELKRQPANLPRTNFAKSPFKGLLLSSYVPESSSLTVYAAMESISSQVLLRQSCHQESAEMKIKIEDIHELFTDLHHHLLSSPSLKVHTQSAQAQQESLQLRVLQGLIYMEALADFDLLERAVGRDGTKLTTDELTTVTAWASSAHGQRCVLHAIVIKRHVEARNITSEPALHIPRALFWAGLALFCYIRFAPPCNGFEPPARLGVDFDFPEFASMGINRETLVCASGALDNNGLLSLKLSFFSIIDLLQHAGHWRISRRFATILSALGDFAFGSG